MSYPGLRPPANVLDFGADPSGVNNSDAAFAAAFVSCPLIYAPFGTYSFASPIVPPAKRGAGIKGDGAGATILQFNGSTSATFINSPAGVIQNHFDGFTCQRQAASVITGAVFQSNTTFFGYITTTTGGSPVSTLNVVGNVRNGGNTAAGDALAVGQYIASGQVSSYLIQKGSGSGGLTLVPSKVVGALITASSGPSSWTIVSADDGTSPLYPVGTATNQLFLFCVAAKLVTSSVTGSSLSVGMPIATGGNNVESLSAGTQIIGGSGTTWFLSFFPGLGATFIGSGSGTNLTVTSVNGSLANLPQLVTGTGVPANTTIVSQTSGTPGGAGVYVTSASTTSSSANLTSSISTTINAYARQTGGAMLSVGGSFSCDEAHIHDIECAFGWIGMSLAGSGFSWVRECYFHGNISDGFNMTTPTGLGEWIISECWSIANGGNGYTMFAIIADTAGEQWNTLSAGSNGGAGCQIVNFAQARMVNCFFGGDFTAELAISGGGTYYRHLLTNINIEQCQAGHGFLLVGTLGGVSMLNCSAETSAGAGVFWNPTAGAGNDDIAIIGGNFDFCGTGLQGTNYGAIELIAGTATIVGIRAAAPNPNQIASGYYISGTANQFNQSLSIVNSAASVFGGPNHIGTSSGVTTPTYTWSY